VIWLVAEVFNVAAFREMMVYYTTWGVNVGLGMLAAIFFGSLLGFIIRSM
jgi:hypothetical protein